VLHQLADMCRVIASGGASPNKQGVQTASDVGNAALVASGALESVILAAIKMPFTAGVVDAAADIVTNLSMCRAAPKTRKALLRAAPAMAALDAKVRAAGRPLARLVEPLATITLEVSAQENFGGKSNEPSATCRSCRKLVTKALRCAKCKTIYCCKECQVGCPVIPLRTRPPDPPTPPFIHPHSPTHSRTCPLIHSSTQPTHPLNPLTHPPLRTHCAPSHPRTCSHSLARMLSNYAP
jgi:hypothetical protein